MSNSNFDENGVDVSGTHWLQYLAFGLTVIFVLLIWLYFRDTNYQDFVKKIFRLLNCSGFNCNGVY